MGRRLLSGFRRRFGNEAVGKNNRAGVPQPSEQLGEALESAREPTRLEEDDLDTMEDGRARAEAWWRTSIIEMRPGIIRYRGYAIEDLIGHVSSRA